MNHPNTKSKAIIAHIKLTKEGQLLAARRVFDLLATGRVNLGINDTDWIAASALEKIGMVCSLNQRTYVETYRLAQ